MVANRISPQNVLCPFMVSSSLQKSPHRVLARKYRPSTFQDMIGQDGMVQVLTNGIHMGRLPHAFILTGIRGVGKTTTARIIARALNCIGPEGQGDLTPSPCGVCEHCMAIAEDRHIDVIEMDAASRTSVDDVRDIIEGTRYKAVSARFKVYIVDEVHMLSKNAFNAFLKTLEEPPPHVKFIFATTELRKVPETVLSRCMRLQLQRIDPEILISYFADITAKEGMFIEPAALALIARAADGSVRDGLSLLDQAMTLCEGKIQEATVLDMLGLSDRTFVFKLFKACIQGIPEETLSHFHKVYLAGSDPLMILQDLLDFTHWIMLKKSQATTGDYPGLNEEQRSEALSVVSSLSFPILSRCWQVLLKGLTEAALAPSAKQAVDIALLRLCHLADLPTPDKVIQSLKENIKATPALSSLSSKVSREIPLAPLSVQEKKIVVPNSFEALLALCDEKREMLLKGYLENEAHLISYKQGEIHMRFRSSVPKDTAKRLQDLLTLWTGISWNVRISDEQGAPTIREKVDKERREIHNQLLEDPLIQTALTAFPGAEIDYIEDHP